MNHNKELNYQVISDACLEIGDLIKLITEMFTKDGKKDFLLKHLGAASLHMAFFIGQVLEEKEKKEISGFADIEKKFLDNCGINHDK